MAMNTLRCNHLTPVHFKIVNFRFAVILTLEYTVLESHGKQTATIRGKSWWTGLTVFFSNAAYSVPLLSQAFITVFFVVCCSDVLWRPRCSAVVDVSFC